MPLRTCAQLCLCLVSIFAIPLPAESSVATYTRPISFEPNRGQANRNVEFLAHGAGYSLFLARGEAVMSLGRARNGAPAVSVRMHPVCANPAPQSEALYPLSGKSNYFIGNDPARWRTDVPTYAQVRYRDIYPGVDLVYYGNQRQLEYDFIVQPNVDPRRIALSFEAPGTPTIENGGALALHAAARELRWKAPVAYQQVNGIRKPVQCSYVRKGRELGFAIGSYDPALPLVIDPVLIFSTYLGGSSDDAGYGIAVDSTGNAYVVGMTGSLDFPTDHGFQDTAPQGGDAFVAKFTADGALVYSTYLGGSSEDEAIAVAVDAYGSAYVTGYTQSTNFPTKNPFQSSNHAAFGNYTCFVTKLAPAGNALVYSTFLGGSVSAGGNGIAVDSNQQAYVAGSTRSPDFPVRNAFQPNYNNGFADGFVTKFSADGKSLIYSTYLGGTGSTSEDAVDAIAVDSSFSAYVTGFTFSSTFPVVNPFQGSIHPGGPDAFVTKFAPDGQSLIYSTFLGGTGTDFGNGIAVDVHGQAYVTGSTTSTDFPTKRAFQPTNRSTCGPDCPNGFVTKFDSDGNQLVYSTYLGGSGNPHFTLGDGGTGIAVNSAGDALITGFTTSTNFPVASAFQNNLVGVGSAFVTKLCPVGTLLFSSYLGGSGSIVGENGASSTDSGYAIAVDSTGSAYITGDTYSSDFPTKKPFQSKYAGGGDAFVTRVTAY